MDGIIDTSVSVGELMQEESKSLQRAEYAVLSLRTKRPFPLLPEDAYLNLGIGPGSRILDTGPLRGFGSLVIFGLGIEERTALACFFWTWQQRDVDFLPFVIVSQVVGYSFALILQAVSSRRKDTFSANCAYIGSSECKLDRTTKARSRQSDSIAWSRLCS